jgi:hypothetical protein
MFAGVSPAHRLARAAVFAAALTSVLAAPAARADTIHGVPLPAGSRRAGPDLYLSGRGFRDTVEHIRRHLHRQALDHDAIPVYRRPGVVVARFLARRTGTWTAIHVFASGGRTYLAILPPLPSDRTP